MKKELNILWNDWGHLFHLSSNSLPQECISPPKRRLVEGEACWPHLALPRSHRLLIAPLLQSLSYSLTYLPIYGELPTPSLATPSLWPGLHSRQANKSQLAICYTEIQTASNSTIHLRAASRQKNQGGGQSILECKFIPNRKYSNLGLSLSCAIYLLWEAGNADVTVKVD